MLPGSGKCSTRSALTSSIGGTRGQVEHDHQPRYRNGCTRCDRIGSTYGIATLYRLAFDHRPATFNRTSTDKAPRGVGACRNNIVLADSGNVTTAATQSMNIDSQQIR